MIDIHIHVLHGVDDGAMDIDEALSMLEVAERAGVTDVIATPHSWAVDSMAHVERALEELNRAAKARRMEVKVHAGCEFNVMRGEAVDRLGARMKDLTLAGSDYLLTEFSNSVNSATIIDCVRKIRQFGLIPIIAHPERYSVMWEDLATMRKARDEGALGQISMGDLIGRNGRLSQDAAFDMIQEGLCSFCATDAHTPDKLLSYMEAVDVVVDRYGLEAADRLFRTNPSMVLDNRPADSIIPALG